MSSTGRPKRHASVPKRFAIEEGYTLPDSPERKRDEKRVLRYLNEADVQRILRDLTVYVLWPDDSLWYEAVLQKPSKDDQTATLFYTDTAEEEEVDLNELIQNRHIAFLKSRSVTEELNDDEISAENIIHMAHSQSVSEASEFGEASSGHEGSTLSQDGLTRVKKQIATSHFLPDRASRFDAFQMIIPGEHGHSGVFDRSELDSSGLLQISEHSVDRLNPMTNGGDASKLRRLGSILSKSSSGSRDAPMPLRLNLMTKLREKTIEQLKAVLKTIESDAPAIEEKNDIEMEEGTETVHDSKQNYTDELAQTIEIEMMKICGGDNNLYKSKLRTLYFNLKESRNPELRRRVLNGEITPEHLVAMSAKELASQELTEWRQKKSEELLQATVLDEDAAAKFSTAAALKQLESLKKQRLNEEQTDISTPVDVSQQHTVVDEGHRVDEMQVDEEHVYEEGDSASEDVTKPQIKVDSVEDEELLPSAEARPEDEALDLDEIPDWAMEVVEAPTPPAQSAPTAPHLYSPKAAEERNNSVFGPVPIQPTPPDLTPLLMRDDANCIVGEAVWQGEVGFAERTPFRAQCVSVAGKCKLKTILTTPQIVVQGRMSVRKVEEFLEKLRSSKSRTVTIAVLQPPSDATDEDFAIIQENVYYFLSRDRTGAMQLGEGLEGYLITKCNLTARLMTAAQTLMDDTGKIPSDIGLNEFLLVVVHKKDWTAAETPATTSVAAPPLSSISVPETMDAIVSDPRIRAGIKPAMSLEKKADPIRQSLPSGLTLQSISNLAAMLGVQKQQPISLSAPSPLLNAIPPHQMTVPGTVAASLPAQGPETSLQLNAQLPQQQPDRPKYLIFEPTTNKVVPLNPASVQYEPSSNRVILVGPLPQGYAVQTVTSPPPPPVVESPSGQERFLRTHQGMQFMIKPGEGVTEETRVNGSAALLSTSTTGLPQATVSAVNALQHLAKPIVQPMIPANSFQGRGGGFRGYPGHGFTNHNDASAMQTLPESGDG